MTSHEMCDGESRAKARRSQRRDKALVVLSFGSLCAIAFVLWWVLKSSGAEAVLRTLGMAAPLVSVPIHVILAATAFPSELVGVANGAVYGFWIGVIYSWLGWWLGSLVEFRLARRGARAFAEPAAKLAGKSGLLAWVRRFPVAHPMFLIVGRQLPFGFDVVNVSAGVAAVAPLRFAICSAVANVPYAILTTATGAGLAS